MMLGIRFVLSAVVLISLSYGMDTVQFVDAPATLVVGTPSVTIHINVNNGQDNGQTLVLALSDMRMPGIIFGSAMVDIGVANTDDNGNPIPIVVPLTVPTNNNTIMAGMMLFWDVAFADMGNMNTAANVFMNANAMNSTMVTTTSPAPTLAPTVPPTTVLPTAAPTTTTTTTTTPTTMPTTVVTGTGNGTMGLGNQLSANGPIIGGAVAVVLMVAVAVLLYRKRKAAANVRPTGGLSESKFLPLNGTAKKEAGNKKAGDEELARQLSFLQTGPREDMIAPASVTDNSDK